MVATQAAFILSALFARGVFANIPFPNPYIECTPEVAKEKCLEGQYCSAEDGLWVYSIVLDPIMFWDSLTFLYVWGLVNCPFDIWGLVICFRHIIGD